MQELLIEPRELPPRQRWMALALVVATLACAAVAQAHFALGHAAVGDQFEDFLRHRSAALVWTAVLIVPSAALCWWTRRWRLQPWPGRRVWIAVLVGIVVLAGALRFYRLDVLPPGLWVDEAMNGMQARMIAEQGWPRVALGEDDVRTGVGAGFVNLAGLAFALFDPHDGPYALRAVAAVAGTVGVAAVAALAWQLFGARAAVVAAAWLAVSQYHLNYSRWGEMPILSSVVETLACLALVVGFRTRGWRSWSGLLAAGLLIGCGLYTYQTFRLFVLLAAVAGLLVGVRRRRAVAERWPAVVAGLLLAALVAAPVAHYAVTQPLRFAERAHDTLILGRADWRAQLAESLPGSLLAFQFVGDENPRHNLPLAPLLTFVPAMLAPLGFLVCLSRWRHLAYALVPVWFVFALVPGVITLEAPHASRLLDAIVPLALMVGVAVDVACGAVQAALPARRVGLALGAAAAAIATAVMAVQEYRAYFIERERMPTFVAAFHPHESAAGRYLATRAPTETVYLDPGMYWAPATQFVAWHYLNDLPADVRMLRLLHDFPPRTPLARDVLFLLSRPYVSLAAVLRALAPRTTCEEFRDAFGRLDLVVCRLAHQDATALGRHAVAGTLRSPYGLAGRFYRDGDGRSPPHYEALLPLGFLDYAIEEEPLGRFRLAVWEGTIDIDAPGEYRFRLHPDAVTLTIDGQPVITQSGPPGVGGSREGRALLRTGRLPIRLVLAPGPQTHYFLWFLWQPPGREVELIPATVLRPPAPDDQPGAARSD